MFDVNKEKLKVCDIDSLVQAYMFLTDKVVEDNAERLNIPLDEGIQFLIDEMKSRSPEELVEYILLDII